MTIVGVVGAVRGAGLSLDPQPEVFVPYVKGGSWPSVNLIVKSTAPPRALAPSIAERIHRVDPALSPATITDMNELVARASGQPFFYARLFGVLAGCRVRAEPGRRLRRRGPRRLGEVQRDRDSQLPRRAIRRHRAPDPARNGDGRRSSRGGRRTGRVDASKTHGGVRLRRRIDRLGRHRGQRAGALGAGAGRRLHRHPARGRSAADGPVEARGGALA